MSPKRPYRDPVTGDWVLVNGQRKGDDTHTSEVMVHLDLQRGSAAAYPDFGSRFHEIKKMTPDAPKRAELATQEALRPLTDDGRILDLEVTAQRGSNASQIRLDAQWTDSRARENERKLRIQVGAG